MTDHNDIHQTKGMAAVREIISAAVKPPEADSETIARLAALSALEYDRVRKPEAEKMGVRAETLDSMIKVARGMKAEEIGISALISDIDPWPEAVDGAALLNEIYQTIRTFIICQDETAQAATLWIAFTWFIDRVQVAPLAIITAPEKRCGKSQLLDLIGRLSYRPIVASNISPSAIFRVIEAYSPTLLIDEADTFLKENEEARGILNSGHTRQSAYVIRVVGDEHEPKQFKTWGAKAISGIGSLPDTLMDRAILLELRRKLAAESVERLRYADKRLFKDLAAKLARYSKDAGQTIEASRPALPRELNDRAQDNWEPLLAIADHAGGGWPQIARSAALKLSGKDQDAPSLSAELLADIQEVFTSDRISTKDLLEKLNDDELKPWATYNRGKPMTPRQLAKRLGEYSIKPEVIRLGGGTQRGFMLSWFEDTFTRYLVPAGQGAESVTAKQTGFPSIVSTSSDVTQPNNVSVTGFQNVTPNLLKSNDCYIVTDGAEKLEVIL